MTSSIINYIIEKYLANILEINPEETKASFLGNAELYNLKINPKIFESLNLPYLELVHGYVGSLKINLSLPRFWLYPIKIQVDKVFFHARQKSVNNLKEEDEIKNMENYKQNKLNSMEELGSQVTELKAQEPGMVQKIMNNIQIEIGEVFFRFDDDISFPGNPFALGLILKKILIKTTTDKFEEDSSDIVPLADINHKLIKVQGLSMFLDYSNTNTPLDFNSRIVPEEREKLSKDLLKYLQDEVNFYTYCMSELNHHSKNIESHHYLLFDLTTSIQTSLNENVKENLLPKMSSNLLIDNLILNMELRQLTVLFKAMGYINLNTLYRAGIYKNFYKKEMTFEEKTKYMDKYIEYYKYKYVKKYQDLNLATKIKTELQEVESGLTYDQVQSMRQAAMIKIDYIFNIENLDQKMTDIKGKWRMFSYFSSNNDEQEIKNLQVQKEKLMLEEGKYDQLVQEQLALEKAIEIDMYKDMPQDYIQTSLNLVLKKCVLAIGELDCRKLLDLTFVDFETKVLVGLNFQNIFLYLQDFYVNQYKFKHPIFNRIIESYADEGIIKEDNSSEIKLRKTALEASETENNYAKRKGALYIEFENNPANEYSNYRLKLRNEKRLYITSNIYVLQYAMSKISDSLKSNIDIKEISKYAKGSVRKYIKEGYSDKIFSGEYQHSNIDVDILLKAPILIIPQNIHDVENTSCMLLSLGECQIKSSLPPRMDPLVDYTKVTDINKLYDIYSISLQGFQLATMGDFTSICSIFNSKSRLDMIENVNVEIKIGNIVEPKNEFFENLRVGVKILNIQFFIRDVQIEYMIYFLDALNQINKLLKSELDLNKPDLSVEKMPYGVLEESISKADPEERKMLLGDDSVSVAPSKFSQSVNQSGQAQGNHNPSISTIARQKRDKIFMSMEFKLARLEINILKSLSYEERSMFNDASGLNAVNPPPSPFKNYLNFVLNNLSFNLSVSESKNTKLNVKLFNMFLFDSDFYYNKTETSSAPQQEMLVHPEFQCILGSINDEENFDHDLSIGKSVSRSASIYSEAHENPEVLQKNKGRQIPSFIEFNYLFMAAKNKSDIRVNFTKLLICLNLSTFSRLYKFGMYYSNLMNSVSAKYKTDVLSKLDVYKNLEQLKEAKEAKKQVKESKGINKKFFKKVLTRMEGRKVNNDDKLKKSMTQNLNVKNEQSLIQMNSEMDKDSKLISPENKLNRRQSQSLMRRGSITTKKEEATYSKRETAKMKFSFEMKEIELNIPLNSNSENTKVLKLNFNMMVKMKSLNDYESFYTILENKLVKQNYFKKNMTMNLMVFNVDFDIINFVNNTFCRNLLSYKILSNSRITMGMKNFLLLDKETNVMNLDVHVEPISMVIGFRQIKILSNYMKAFGEFSVELKQGGNEEEGPYAGMGIAKQSTNINLQQDAQDPYFRKDTTTQQQEMTKYKSIIVQKLQEINDQLETSIKYNITNFNNLMDVNFKLDKAIIKLIDNTGIYDTPLNKIELSKISFKFISNSDPSDSDNMAQALVEMISQKEVTQYNIYHLYLYLDACFNIELLSYNQKVSDWEPILEPWNATVKMSQVNKFTRLKMDFISDVMLNMNLSFISVTVLNKIMKKMGEDESNWVEEGQSLSIANKTEKEKKILVSGGNEISLEFTNLTGLELSFWFDAQKTQKFLLKSAEKKYFTKNEMNLVYKKLTDSELSLMKKDKFTFTIFNCEPIEGVDFSYNHYTNIRLPLGKQMRNIHSDYNFIEVSVKIKNSGLMKSISIESNMTVHNNTQYRIGLHVVKSHEFVNNFNGQGSPTNPHNVEMTHGSLNSHMNKNNTSINPMLEEPLLENKVVNFEQSGVETIEPFNYVKIPLNWLTEPYMMFGRIIDENDEYKAYKLFYDELNFIYKFGDEFKEKNVYQNEEEKEYITQQFTNTYSKIITFDYENNTQLSFSLDMFLLKSSSDAHILDDSNKNMYLMNTYYYMLVINPPIILENQIPYNINFQYGDMQYQSNEPTNTYLLPLQKYPCFGLNYSDNRNDLKLMLDYFNGLKFTSDNFSFLDEIRDNKKIIKLYNDKENIYNEQDINSKKDFYEIVVEYKTMESFYIYNYTYLKLERNLSKSKRMTFYVEYLIVSKLDSKLFIKPSDSDEPDDQIIRNTNNTIYGHKVNLFNLPRNEEKAKFKTEISEWSHAFKINTHGVDGVVSLETKKKPDLEEINVTTLDNTYITDIGMIISSSSYFNHSTLVILEPHYLMVNKLGIDLQYRQMFSEHNPCREICDFFDTDTKLLTFTKPNDIDDVKKLNKYLQFIIENKNDTNFRTVEENWSPIMNIENIEEFNIKLPIPKEDVERLKSSHGSNVFTYDGENYFLLTRVTINSNDHVLIYIILSSPKFPQLVIRNQTDETLIVKQADSNSTSSYSVIKVKPYDEVPYAWNDLLMSDKRMIVTAQTKNVLVSFERFEKLEGVRLYEDQMKYLYFSINMENKNVTRALKIQMEEKDEDIKAIKQIFTGKKMSRILKVNLSIKGIGFSIIDDTPKENFYISIYCIDIRYINYVMKSSYFIENTENIELYMKNIQIDYCLEDSFKNIIYPKNQILPSNEREKEQKGEVYPFIGFLLTRKTTHNLQTENITTKISQIDFTMQELNVKIDQFVLNRLLSLVSTFKSVTSPKEGSVAQSSFKKESMTLTSKNISLAPSEFCPELKTQVESYDSILAQTDESNMIFIEALMLSALKINLTLRIDISTLELSLVPGFIVKVLGTLGNAIARISDSPLRFSELILQNCFADAGRYTQILQKHYVKQGIVQFYKILGSSDLIGNPIGLVDRLGTGMLEFFNEPRKGFLQGPKQFGEGVAKGINSFVSNVIGGGFDTVGKITGTLLTATK
jgi:hypothetical protein